MSLLKYRILLHLCVDGADGGLQLKETNLSKEHILIHTMIFPEPKPKTTHFHFGRHKKKDVVLLVGRSKGYSTEHEPITCTKGKDG